MRLARRLCAASTQTHHCSATYTLSQVPSCTLGPCRLGMQRDLAELKSRAAVVLTLLHQSPLTIHVMLCTDGSCCLGVQTAKLILSRTFAATTNSGSADLCVSALLSGQALHLSHVLPVVPAVAFHGSPSFETSLKLTNDQLHGPNQQVLPRTQRTFRSHAHVRSRAEQLPAWLNLRHMSPSRDQGWFRDAVERMAAFCPMGAGPWWISWRMKLVGATAPIVLGDLVPYRDAFSTNLCCNKGSARSGRSGNLTT